MLHKINLTLKAVNYSIVPLNWTLDEIEEYNHIHLETHCSEQNLYMFAVKHGTSQKLQEVKKRNKHFEEARDYFCSSTCSRREKSK